MFVEPSVEKKYTQKNNFVKPRWSLRFAEAKELRAVSIFDASGRKVDEIAGPRTGGVVSWGEGHTAGVYFIVPQDENLPTQKVILAR